MSPGDVIAMYATAKDARTTSRTDMMFIEAEPFERNYSQSQQMGGGGGGGGGDRIRTRFQSARRKSSRPRGMSCAAARRIKPRRERAVPLRDSNQAEGAGAVAGRALAAAAQLAGANQEFQTFVKDLEAAADEMGPASDKLKGQGWKDALGPEQKALQHLLRAEATFRDIQVAFGTRAAEVAAAAARPRSRQHVRPRTRHRKEPVRDRPAVGGSASAEQRQKEVDEALQKLDRTGAPPAGTGRSSRTKASSRRSSSAGSRKCCGAKPRSCASKWSSSPSSSKASKASRGQQGQQGPAGTTRPAGPKRTVGPIRSERAAGARTTRAAGPARPAGPQGQRGNQQQTAAGAGSPEAGARRYAAGPAEPRSRIRTAPEAQADARRAAERLSRSAAHDERHAHAAGRVAAWTIWRIAPTSWRAAGRFREAPGADLRRSAAGTQRARHTGQGHGSSRLGSSPDEKDKMAGELDRLQKDMQQAARDLAGTQPAAAGRVRDGLSNMQQTEITNRTQGVGRSHPPGHGQLTWCRRRRPWPRRSIRWQGSEGRAAGAGPERRAAGRSRRARWSRSSRAWNGCAASSSR